MNKEIERKWILPDKMVDEVLEHPVVYISQGYYNGVRFRKVHNPATNQKSYYQTIKIGEGISIKEYEIELLKHQFDELWKTTKDRRIFKHRYFIGIDTFVDFIVTQDIPLMVIEKEFKTIKEAKEFKPPDFFGKEVTNDIRYNNIYIAEHGFIYEEL